MLQTAILAALAYFICYGGNWILGQSMIERPIIVGTVAGLLLGDLRQGIIIGAALEAIFMGSVNIGGQVSAEPAAATVFAVAFSLNAGGHVSPAAALAIAVPIGVLAGIVVMFINNVVLSLLVPVMDRMAEKNNGKGIAGLNFGAWFFRFFLFSMIVFVGVLVGQGAVETFVNGIPDKVMNGLNAMGGFLPAVGFAILLKMLWSKELAVYYILGFMLVAYLKLPLIAVAALGLIIVAVTAGYDKKILDLEKVGKSPKQKSDIEKKNDEVEDFFS